VRLTIYVPDDLGERVKTSGLNVSKTCQAAFRAALLRQGESTREILEDFAAVMDEFNDRFKAAEDDALDTFKKAVRRRSR
jgi:post-segregation antitoxin (ccd killing protein)